MAETSVYARFRARSAAIAYTVGLTTVATILQSLPSGQKVGIFFARASD
jgi:hypothetical protein